MELIDTHCHLYLSGSRQYEGGTEAMLRRAKVSGVKKVLAIGTDLRDSELNIQAGQMDSIVAPCVGIHPDNIANSVVGRKQQLEILRKHCANAQVVALGEAGLDYQAELGPQIQQDYLDELISIAQDTQKAIIIHMRDSVNDMLALLGNWRTSKVKIVLHCFSADYKAAQTVWDMGYFTSFTNMIAYPRNSTLQEVVNKAPLAQIMLETDAPFLPPQSRRGTICEASDVAYVAQAVAALKQLPVEEVARKTTANAISFFGLKG